MQTANLDKTLKLSESATPLVEDIKNYKILRMLGRGETSNVYLGVDKTSLKFVAIKKMRPECSIGVRHKMFAVESSLCGKLNHPNIVTLIESDSSDADSTYIIMEYVEGESLEVFSTPMNLLPVETVMDIVRQAAEALNYAFQMGVIHRDVKPANIILRKDGLVKLTDFGCALLFNSDTTQIAGAGSLSYMSPEQITGMELNHQSDIYSLGAVLYRLLTGYNTFNATDNYAAIHQIINHPHVQIDVHRTGLPKELIRITNRALQKKISDRYKDWDEFLTDLYAASGVNRVASQVDEQNMIDFMSRSVYFKDILEVEMWEELIRITDSALQKNVVDHYQDWKELFSDLHSALRFRVASEIDEQTMFDLMSRCAFFKDFITVEIWEVLHASLWRTFPHGKQLFKEGEHGFSFFILLKGSVVITKKNYMLNVIQAGDCVGENACLYKGSSIRGATVAAQGEVVALEISKVRLEGFSKDVCIRMDRAFLRSLNNKLAESNGRVLQLIGI